MSPKQVACNPEKKGVFPTKAPRATPRSLVRSAARLTRAETVPEAARGRQHERGVVILVHRAEAEEVFARDLQHDARALDEEPERRLLLDALKEVVRNAGHQVFPPFRAGAVKWPQALTRLRTMKCESTP